MVKAGVTTSINTKHQCITAMKEYENKSLEASYGLREASLVPSLVPSLIPSFPCSLLIASLTASLTCSLPPRFLTCSLLSL